MDKIINKEYPSNLLVYYGCITTYFERLSFVIFEFLKLGESSDYEKIISKKRFEDLKKLMNKKITNEKILKGDLKKKYDDIYKSIEKFQEERNKIIHSIPTKSYSERKKMYKYNRRDVENMGIDKLEKLNLNELEDFCVDLIKFVKTLKDFLFEYSALKG